MVLGDTSMVVAASMESAADEPRVLCVIRDMTNTQCTTKFNLNLPVSWSADAVVEEVARQCGYIPGSFSLVYEQQNGAELSEVFFETRGGEQLGAICSDTSVRRHNFNVMEKDGHPPQKIESSGDSPSTLPVDNLSLGASASPTIDNKDIFTSNYPTSSTSSYNSDYKYSYASALMKSDTGYVGLVNQAMTCYLNSLLQTLYMTPEFRNAIYRWEFDGSEDEAVKSIPYQLQRLFLNLQTSTRRAVETTDITRSFGWDSSEAWQQHDVQELCRVMFDALEKKWVNTDQADLINQLYQGKLKDYVKCLECGNESARTDAFLDIPLVIRPFGATQAYGSVEQAMEAFVQPEVLDGNNQYYCEKCNKKCNAHKGLKFTKFPYLLMLQLKRFDFDYSTMHRIKLNDRVTFPMVLDLDKLVASTGGKTDVKNGEKEADGEEDTETTKDVASPGGQDDGVDEGIDIGYSGSVASTNSEVTSVNSDSSLNSEAAHNDRNAEESKFHGPYVYELFSIMVHSGSAAGGHYYAYIKSFTDGQWYSFNDQHVSTISMDDIRKTYGGSSSSRGYYSATFASSTNAYMLIYRQINKDTNADYMDKEGFPSHLQEELNMLNKQEELDRKLREIEKSMCRIKLYCQHPVQDKQVETKLEVHKDKTLKEATKIAWKLLELDKHTTLENVRLVKYDELHDSLERSFEGMEEEPISTVLGGVKTLYTFDLLMEVKRPEEEFQEYKPGGVTVKVLMVDLATETIQLPMSIRACSSQTVQQFKELVAQTLNISADNMRCVLERYYNDLRPLSSPNKTLKSEGFYKSNKVFIECSGEDDPEAAFTETKFYKLLDRYQNTIRIYISLPKQRAAHLDSPLLKELQEEAAKEQEMDEGIDEHDGGKHSFPSATPACDLPGCGPLRSSHVSSADVHSMISETIHRQNLSETQRSLSDTTLASASAKASVKYSDETPRDTSYGMKGGGSGDTGPDQSLSEGTARMTEGPCSSPVQETDPQEPGSYTGQIESEKAEGKSEIAGETSETERAEPEATGAQSEEAEQSSHSPADPAVNTETVPESQGTEEQTDTSSHEDPNTSTAPERDAPEASGSRWQKREPDPEQQPPAEEEYHYFRAIENSDPDTNDRVLTVHLDKRITLNTLKKELENFLGVSSDHFNVYKVYSNNQEFEATRLNETLSSYVDDSKLMVKYGRALKKGEYRIKIFQLLIDEPEPSKFLFETVFAKGMTVEQSKKLVSEELKVQCGMDIPPEKCRLRKKAWKNPGVIYLNEQIHDQDIAIYANFEIFLEILDEPDLKMSMTQLAVYCRRWWPSKYEVGPFKEVVLDKSSVDELKEKISEISGIPPENVEFAKAQGSFPCEMSVLEIHNELDWNPAVTSLKMWPLYIFDDGNVVYYRDKEESLQELSEEKKKELQQRENARLSKTSSRINYSPRKERALKIYTDDTPSGDKTEEKSPSPTMSPDLD